MSERNTSNNMRGTYNHTPRAKTALEAGCERHMLNATDTVNRSLVLQDVIDQALEGGKKLQIFDPETGSHETIMLI